MLTKVSPRRARGQADMIQEALVGVEVMGKKGRGFARYRA